MRWSRTGQGRGGGHSRAGVEFVMRQQEGTALHAILSEHLEAIDSLVQAAQDHLPDREAAQRAQFEAGLKRVMTDARDIDPDRTAQELAQIVIKSDVMEEIDRLRAHVVATRFAGTGCTCWTQADF